MLSVVLTSEIREEITRLSSEHNIDAQLLERFAYFVAENQIQQKKAPKRNLTVAELKNAVYNRFNVNSTDELKRSGSFLMATDGMEEFDLRLKSTWEMLYRKFVGILPHEENEQGYGCINGINIFKYFKPWQVFGLNSETATKDDLKSSYRRLSKIYHPDNLETGDREVFERIELMYQSLIGSF